jgi:membrane protein YdbS with pleckstrin-like domain
MKKDKGFELIYENLSDRRKFIRTVWLTAIAVAIVVFLAMMKADRIVILLIGIIMGVACVWQLITTYRQWKYPKRMMKIKEVKAEQKSIQEEDKKATLLIRRISNGLLLICILTCVGFILYGKLVVKDANVTAFVVMGAIYLLILFENLVVYKLTMREKDSEEEEKEDF